MAVIIDPSVFAKNRVGQHAPINRTKRADNDIVFNDHASIMGKADQTLSPRREAEARLTDHSAGVDFTSPSDQRALDHRPGANPRSSADLNTWPNNRTCTDLTIRPDYDSLSQYRPWCDLSRPGDIRGGGVRRRAKIARPIECGSDRRKGDLGIIVNDRRDQIRRLLQDIRVGGDRHGA